MQRVDKDYWLSLAEVTKLMFFGVVNGECKKCVRVCVCLTDAAVDHPLTPPPPEKKPI